MHVLSIIKAQCGVIIFTYLHVRLSFVSYYLMFMLFYFFEYFVFYLYFIHITYYSFLVNFISNPSLTGCFPNICKTAKVIPIFKTESRLLCNNYRPISLLSNIIKIIEKIVHQKSNKFLEGINCFYNLHIRFRLNHNTNNALLSVTENTQTDLDNEDFTAGVFIDLKKAFDIVDHDILLKKLEYYGVRELSRDLLQSY